MEINTSMEAKDIINHKEVFQAIEDVEEPLKKAILQRRDALEAEMSDGKGLSQRWYVDGVPYFYNKANEIYWNYPYEFWVTFQTTLSGIKIDTCVKEAKDLRTLRNLLDNERNSAGATDEIRSRDVQKIQDIDDRLAAVQNTINDENFLSSRPSCRVTNEDGSWYETNMRDQVLKDAGFDYNEPEVHDKPEDKPQTNSSPKDSSGRGLGGGQPLDEPVDGNKYKL